MKDQNGFYYYPNPEDTKTRVYVRNGEDGIEFRLWHLEHDEVWEKHGWLAFSVIEAAAAMYKDRNAESNPLALYDLNVAKALLKSVGRPTK